MTKRFYAYAIDVVTYVLLILASLLIIDAINEGLTLYDQNNMLFEIVRIILSWTLFLILTFVFFGLVPYFLRDTIGKRIVGIRTVSTYGVMTAVRIYIREFILKHLFGTSLLIVPLTFLFSRENYDKVSWVVVPFVLLLLLNAYSWLVKRMLLHNYLLFTRVEDENYKIEQSDQNISPY